MDGALHLIIPAQAQQQLDELLTTGAIEVPAAPGAAVDGGHLLIWPEITTTGTAALARIDPLIRRAAENGASITGVLTIPDVGGWHISTPNDFRTVSYRFVHTENTPYEIAEVLAVHADLITAPLPA